MIPQFRRVGERTTEFSLEHGCPLCGGAVELRVSPEGTRSVCASCQTIGRAEIRRTREGLEIDFAHVAKA
jgi:hypothetical protein